MLDLARREYDASQLGDFELNDVWLQELVALTRDEDFTRGFMTRHQDKLVYGSDCSDRVGSGPTCSGAATISVVRRLAGSKAIERKLLHDNAKKLFPSL